MESKQSPMEDLGLSFWHDRNVFVTGATGLLGSWLVEELLEREANVICLIRDQVPASRLIGEGLIDRVSIVRGDLVEYETLLRALNEYEVNTVFHLGAQTIVGTAARSALSTFESNVKGTWVLLEACRANARLVERVIVASSDKAYGAHDVLPYTEETPLVGRYPYDVSKSCADLIALSYFHTYKVPVAVTRCGNLFGGGDMNWNRLIPGTIRSAIRDESPLIRSDGSFVRDYFYVRDAVEAYMSLAEQVPNEGVVGEAFNFGTETPLSVIEAANSVLASMGRSDLELTILNEASNEIPKQFLDCSKAHRVLNWQPGRAFEQGLADTVAWYRQHLKV